MIGVHYNVPVTTGFGCFAGSRTLPAKATLHSAKPLPGAVPGKEPPAKIQPAKNSLPRAFYQAPGKDFAESKHGHGVGSVGPFFTGSCVRDTRQKILIFFHRFFFAGSLLVKLPAKLFLFSFSIISLPGVYWTGSRQSFFYFFLIISLPGVFSLAPGKDFFIFFPDFLCRVP